MILYLVHHFQLPLVVDVLGSHHTSVAISLDYSSLLHSAYVAVTETDSVALY